MNPLRRPHHPARWMALAAVLALALLPTVSRLLAATAGGGWVEVCTPRGTRLVATGSDAAAPASPAAIHVDACGFCALASHSAMLLPGPIAVSLPLRTQQAQARPTASAQRTPRPASDAQPRGPPTTA